MTNYKFLLFSTLYFLLSTSLYAVEGNEPVPELELPVLEVEISEDTLQSEREITQLPHFPSFSFGLKYGESELGEGYNIEIGGCAGINNPFTAQFLEVDDKTSFGAGTELRVIGRQSITGIDAETRRYKIGDGYWENLYLANSSISLYLGENIFKVLASGCYESESLWDLGVLWGRRFWQSLFMGVGISAPIVAPFVQIDWRVNDFFSINISRCSKRVTRTLESIYMNQPYVVQNPKGLYPDLKHEHWNSLSRVEFLFGDNINIEFSHKWIENMIHWNQADRPFEPIKSVKPVNGEKQQEWSGEVNFKMEKIKGKVSFKYIPLVKISDYPVGTLLLPKISFNNTLEISLPYDAEINLGSKYIGERTLWCSGSCIGKTPPPPPTIIRGTFPCYWLLSYEFSKKLRNWELWVKINNLTNTKYEIIKGVEGPGRCIQTGFNIEM